MKNKSAFERIHNINHEFNRIFSWPLYLASFLVIVIFFFSTYHLRIFISLLINFFFNRFTIYLSYFSRFIARPAGVAVLTLVYLVPLGAYAMLFALYRGESSAPKSLTDRESAHFQS